SFFPGTGTFDLPLDAETSFDVIGGGGNAQVEITTDGVMNACVIYYYVPEADLSLTKTLNSNMPTVDDIISFTISVTNDGPTATTNVLVYDALPAELEFVSASPADFNPATNTWTVGDLNIEETKELTLSARILAGGETMITNSAQVSASDIPDPDSTPANDDPDEDDQDAAEFYVHRLGIIGDYVWYDDDRELDQDAVETGVENMTVYLYDTQENLLATTQTNNSGWYAFPDLRAGSYTVRLDTLTLPEDYALLTDDDIEVTLPAGEDYLDADYPIAKAYSRVGDYVWWDKDNDKIQDPEEPGIANIRLILETSDGRLDTAYTDESGHYLFRDISETSVQVTLDTTTIAPGFLLTSGTTPTGFFDLPPGTRKMDVDYGLHSYRGAVGDLVWFDLNKNGVYDTGEPGIPGVTLYLYDDQGNPPRKTATDAKGIYVFQNVPRGRYTVKVGKIDCISGCVATTPETHSLSLNKYQQYMDADFGFWSPAGYYLDNAFRLVLAWYENPLTADPRTFDSHANIDIFDGNGLAQTRYEYDILQAWISGIDGFVVEWFGTENNERNPSTERLINLLETTEELYNDYGDQGFDFRIIAVLHEQAIGTLEGNLQFLADSALIHPGYFGVRDESFQPLFIYDDNENAFQAQIIKEKANKLLPPTAYLAWNEGYDTAVFEHMDLLYPWVQAMNKEFDKTTGLRWGEEYLDFEYDNMNDMPGAADVLFAIGTAWPGYDEGSALGIERNWIDPQDTLVYHLTWEKILDYQQIKPMGWALIESWNVFNSKTDIVTTLENRYIYQQMTNRYSHLFKGNEAPRCQEDLGFVVPQKIRQARIAALQNPQLAWQTEFAVSRALANFFEHDYQEAISIIDQMLGLAISSPRIIRSGGTFVELEWDAAHRANAYHIHYSIDPNDFTAASRIWPEVKTVGKVTTALLTGLEVSQKYYLAVTPADTHLDAYTNASWFDNQFTNGAVISVQMTDIDDSNLFLPEDHTDNQLVFVKGSPTYQKGNKKLDWSNAVDQDTEGWDGTVLAKGSDAPSDNAWAVFQFADSATYQFNYINLLTDNGPDDNTSAYEYQTTTFEIWVSLYSDDLADFTRVGEFQLKFDGTLMEWFKLDQFIEARYVMIKLVAPNYYPGGWRQIVEFGVHSEDKAGAIPAANTASVTELPREFSCQSNYPNPFNPTTTIRYSLPQESFVTLQIYNIQGQLIETLVQKQQSAGHHQIEWQAQHYPSGMYIYRFSAGEFTAIHQMTLLK
ncbi:T9SS type A sorting domain-containing protein, partial [candidate division KSB1 bacterium]|nr:T9SS type A sorting domain-containing protein [candidate division KSB1 bacterium]